MRIAHDQFCDCFRGSHGKNRSHQKITTVFFFRPVFRSSFLFRHPCRHKMLYSFLSMVRPISSHFAPSCVARWMGPRVRAHSFSSWTWGSFARLEYTLNPKWSVLFTSGKEWPYLIRLRINMLNHEKFWFGEILLFKSNLNGIINQRENQTYVNFFILLIACYRIYRKLGGPIAFRLNTILGYRYLLLVVMELSMF
jgi:hypothetical protein